MTGFSTCVPWPAGGEPRSTESLCVGRHRSVCCPLIRRNGSGRVFGVDLSNAKAQGSAQALQGSCRAIAKCKKIDLILNADGTPKVAKETEWPFLIQHPLWKTLPGILRCHAKMPRACAPVALGVDCGIHCAWPGVMPRSINHCKNWNYHLHKPFSNRLALFSSPICSTSLIRFSGDSPLPLCKAMVRAF